MVLSKNCFSFITRIVTALTLLESTCSLYNLRTVLPVLSAVADSWT